MQLVETKVRQQRRPKVKPSNHPIDIYIFIHWHKIIPNAAISKRLSLNIGWFSHDVAESASIYLSISHHRRHQDDIIIIIMCPCVDKQDTCCWYCSFIFLNNATNKKLEPESILDRWIRRTNSKLQTWQLFPENCMAVILTTYLHEMVEGFYLGDVYVCYCMGDESRATKKLRIHIGP